MKDHVLRLVRWYNLAGEYLSNYRIDKAFLRGSFPVMVSEARFTRTGGMPSFSSEVVRLEEKPPRISCSFRIKMCVLMCVLIDFNRGVLVFKHDTDKLCGCSSSLQSSIIFYQ